MDGWVNSGTPLGSKKGGLPWPKCAWSICELLLAANFGIIGPTQKERCFGNVFLKYLEMPEYLRALVMVATKQNLNTTKMKFFCCIDGAQTKKQ